MGNILLCETVQSEFMSNCHVLQDDSHGKDKKVTQLNNEIT